MISYLKKPFVSATVLATLGSLLLLGIASFSFTRTGPPIPEAILQQYTLYLVYSMGRLTVWAWLLLWAMAFAGAMTYQALLDIFRVRAGAIGVIIAGGVGIALLTLLRFISQLLYIPSSIVASYNYNIDYLVAIWRWLTPDLVDISNIVIAVLFCAILMLAALFAGQRKDTKKSLLYLCTLIAYSGVVFLAVWSPEPPRASAKSMDRPNIIMIGSDTLRADRLGVNGYKRDLTPNIDKLASQGVSFSNFFVPIARTAPSMVALHTSTFPPRNKIRSNFTSDENTVLPLTGLATALEKGGYNTAAVGDWSASDLEKFNFGFGELDLAPDQWNLKTLLRQGPKDLRLFVSLFTHNRFGKRFLPEIYYLAGVPLTEEVGRDARRMIHNLSGENKPFFLEIFMASTHGPFGSPYPYYMMYTDPDYQGNSKFVISGVNSIKGIIKRQGESAATFDIEQINNLYDGAVRSFDDEVKHLIEYLNMSEIARSTIVIIFSDHGTDLWENGLWGQGNSLSMNNYRVPLIMTGPGLPADVRIEKSVRSIDVAPTILEFAEVEIPESFNGKSLLPLLLENSVEDNRVAYIETALSLTRLSSTLDKKRKVTIIDALDIPNIKTASIALKPEFKLPQKQSAKRMVLKGATRLYYDPLSNENSPFKFESQEGKIDQDTAESLRISMIKYLKEDEIEVTKINKGKSHE